MILQSPIVTLTTCDTEPIHLLGAIQPFGFLLTVNAEWVVVRASDNVEAFLGQPWGRIVGQPFEKCLSADLLHDIRGCLQIASGSSSVECILGKRLHPKGPTFDIAVHQSGREVVLEFEPSSSEVTLSLATLRGMVARVERQILPEAMYREAARQVRALTGFDRVMVYRFDHDGAGEVVGESMTGGLSPFLGLRYPAADIPLQARALYERNYIRIITDVDAQPVPVAPALSPEGEKLDLSMSVLRSVSPIHIEYLKNMGVYASMSISILQGGKLWGLIACHHNSPKNLSLETRSTAELFGRMLSYLLEVRHRDDEASHDARAAEIQSRLAFAFAEPNSSMRNIAEFLAETGDYIAADGIGTYHSGEIALTGLTPTRDEFLRLVRFLDKTASGRVYATHNLSDVYPPAADFVMRAAGVLSIPISRTPRDYLVFFRREVIKTVTWAGEPAKVGMIGPNGPRLTPRKSFAAWQESVHNQCKPWGKRDVRVAEALRLTLVELVLRMAEAAEADRLGAHQHQEILIAELNHRIRNILGLVRGLVTQSAAASTNDHATFVKSFDARIRSLARSHDLLTSNFWKPASFHALVKAEIATYGAVDKRLSLIGPDVLLEPKAFTTVALLVHELVTNAQKHGALSGTRRPGHPGNVPRRHAKYLRFLARNRRPSRVTAQTAGIWQHSFGATGSLRAQRSQPSHVSSARFCYGPGPAGDVCNPLGSVGGKRAYGRRRDGASRSGDFSRIASYISSCRGQSFYRNRRGRDVEGTGSRGRRRHQIGRGRACADGVEDFQFRVAGCQSRPGEQLAGCSIAARKQHPLLFRHRLRRWCRCARLDERRADRLEAVQQSIVHRCFAAVAFYPGARRIDG